MVCVDQDNRRAAQASESKYDIVCTAMEGNLKIAMRPERQKGKWQTVRDESCPWLGLNIVVIIAPIYLLGLDIVVIMIERSCIWFEGEQTNPLPTVSTFITVWNWLTKLSDRFVSRL